MISKNNAMLEGEKKNLFLVSLVVYSVFCVIGFISRFIPPVFLIFLLFGILFPLLWAKLNHDWASIGFSRENLPQALFWGVLAGLIWSTYTYLFFYSDNSPNIPLILQIALGIPIWFLILSPFQELFFRGWLQPRFQIVLGKWWGLIFTSLAFTLWHFFPQLEGTMTANLPLSSFIGVFSIFLSGLLFGYILSENRKYSCSLVSACPGRDGPYNQWPDDFYSIYTMKINSSKINFQKSIKFSRALRVRGIFQV